MQLFSGPLIDEKSLGKGFTTGKNGGGGGGQRRIGNVHSKGP